MLGTEIYSVRESVLYAHGALKQKSVALPDLVFYYSVRESAWMLELRA